MPMQSVDGTPPTQRWVPQSEPLDLDEPLGLLLDGVVGVRSVYLEDLDPAAQHRIEKWPEAVALLEDAVSQMLGSDNVDDVAVANRIHDWLAANAPEES